MASSAFAGPLAVECREGAPTVCLVADPDASSTLVALTLPLGSADETAAEHGVAHYVEHLTFRGRQAEAGEMTSGGAGIDGFGNAYTGPWATTYHWTVPPSRGAEAVTRAMAVLGPLDASDEAAAQEREVVAREREQRADGPAARDQQAMLAAMYEEEALARPVIGTADEVAALTLGTAYAFHDRLYDARTAVLVLAGDVDWDMVEGVQTGGTALPRRAPEVAIPAAASLVLTREDVVQRPERWQMALSVLPLDADVLPALAVTNAYLASSLPAAPGAALARARDDTRDAWAAVYELVPGLVALEARLALRPGGRPQDLDPPWAAWDDLWTALVRDGLDAATVSRLRDRMTRDEARTRGDGIAAAWSLISWLETGATTADWAVWPDRLAAVTPDDVASLLRALDAPVRTVTLDTLSFAKSGDTAPVEDHDE